MTERAFGEVWDFANLLLAFHKAARGKRARPDVTAFEYALEWQLLRLRDEIREQTYRLAGYRRFAIADPKPRLISAAPFRDRVVHHALCNVIEPIFERRFIADSYANRSGKGIHAALDRCTALARRYPFVLRCDIVQFFPSVDLVILQHALWREIADPRIRWLCEQIIVGGAAELTEQYRLIIFSDEAPAAASLRQRGLPISNQTSQFWANCYLDRLDHFVKDDLGCTGYLRYVDDFLLFSNDKAQLHHWKAAICAWLATHLRLVLHERESAVMPVTVGIPFLGFQVFPAHRRLRQRNGMAFAHRLRDMAADYADGTMAIVDVSARVQGWVAHVAYGDTWRLRASIFDHVPFTTTAESSVSNATDEGITDL